MSTINGLDNEYEFVKYLKNMVGYRFSLYQLQGV